MYKQYTHYAHTRDMPQQPTEPGWCNTVYRAHNVILTAAVLAILIALVVNILTGVHH